MDGNEQNELRTLRDKLGELDNTLFRQIVERQRIVTAIGRLKAAVGRPTRDYRQEKEVIERAKKAAAALGVNAGFA